MVVTFSLRFSQLIDVKEAEQQLGAGLQGIEGGVLVIDTKSISITGECVCHDPGPCWPSILSFHVFLYFVLYLGHGSWVALLSCFLFDFTL